MNFRRFAEEAAEEAVGIALIVLATAGGIVALFIVVYALSS